MLKRNGSNRIEFDLLGFINIIIQIVVIGGTVLVVHFNTVNRIDVSLTNLTNSVMANQRAIEENKTAIGDNRTSIKELSEKHSELKEKVVTHIAAGGK